MLPSATCKAPVAYSHIENLSSSLWSELRMMLNFPGKWFEWFYLHMKAQDLSLVLNSRNQLIAVGAPVVALTLTPLTLPKQLPTYCSCISVHLPLRAANDNLPPESGTLQQQGAPTVNMPSTVSVTLLALITLVLNPVSQWVVHRDQGDNHLPYLLWIMFNLSLVLRNFPLTSVIYVFNSIMRSFH